MARYSVLIITGTHNGVAQREVAVGPWMGPGVTFLCSIWLPGTTDLTEND